MIAASLFSGIGAPECAMPGWNWAWHAEIEPFPCAVMAKRHPSSVNLGDVNAPDFCERALRVARPDVLVFGSPCQDFSIAGKRLGMDGPRGNLALVALGIVGRLKPGWFTFENVPGLLSSWSGAEDGPDEPGARWDSVENSDFAAFLGAVDELGYHGAWASLDAQWRGLAQRRDRLFFVGHRRDWRRAAAVLLEPDGLRGDRPPSREKGEGPAGTIKSSLARGSADEAECATLVAGAVTAKWRKGTGGPSGDECQNLVAATLDAASGRSRGAGTPVGLLAFDETQVTCPDNRCQPEEGDPCHPLASGARPPAIAFDCKAGGDTSFSVSEHVAGALRGEGHGGGHAAVAFKPSHFTRDKDGAPAETFPPLSADADKGDQEAVVFQTRLARNGRGGPEPVAPALNGADAGATSDMRPVLASGSIVRRLTPRECERLQGFPDDYTLVDHRGKPATDGPRYRALGNSMARPVIEWVLRRIEIVDAVP